ncbi:Chromosome segregation ATPase [Giardia duodenalis]|uniref:Chromosome segregation ATPase n=1 Tax=Giardia intestinalis TaxID=5741 RepID=V6U5C2_GIAIN|nr:Chromosome segregation ATPase [Giardia intestinalis]
MAAKANEHLTRMIRRDRAESLVTQRPALHLLLTREAPEQKESNRLLTDTGESSEHPAHPTAPG